MTPRPRDPTGDSGLVSWCRKTSDRIDELKIIAVEGGEIDRKTNGYVLKIPKQRIAGAISGDADLSLFVVAVWDEAGGILQCQKVSYTLIQGQDPDLPSSWTESIASELTNVRLPPAVAAGPLPLDANGTLVPTTKLSESLQPFYGLGSRIVAARFGGVWYDLNYDARHWDVSYRLVNVCIKVNGVDTTWQMYVRAGPAFAP